MLEVVALAGCAADERPILKKSFKYEVISVEAISCACRIYWVIPTKRETGSCLIEARAFIDGKEERVKARASGRICNSKGSDHLNLLVIQGCWDDRADPGRQHCGADDWKYSCNNSRSENYFVDVSSKNK